jgi:hypothetical protein
MPARKKRPQPGEDEAAHIDLDVFEGHLTGRGFTNGNIRQFAKLMGRIHEGVVS